MKLVVYGFQLTPPMLQSVVLRFQLGSITRYNMEHIFIQQGIPENWVLTPNQIRFPKHQKIGKSVRPAACMADRVIQALKQFGYIKQNGAGWVWQSTLIELTPNEASNFASAFLGNNFQVALSAYKQPKPSPV